MLLDFGRKRPISLLQGRVKVVKICISSESYTNEEYAIHFRISQFDFILNSDRLDCSVSNVGSFWFIRSARYIEFTIFVTKYVGADDHPAACTGTN